MSTETVTLSEAAAKRIAAIVAADAEKQALRVSVEGGGCSGFSYKFDLVAEDDKADPKEGTLAAQKIGLSCPSNPG